MSKVLTKTSAANGETILLVDGVAAGGWMPQPEDKVFGWTGYFMSSTGHESRVGFEFEAGARKYAYEMVRFIAGGDVVEEDEGAAP